jgi:tetratricopeptide (TPR) repeat protein
MDDMYVWLEDKLWIPVEVTLVGKPFAKAWEAGSINYHKGQDNGLTMLNVEEEWQTYKPALLPETSLKAIDVTREAIEKRYPNEFSSLQKISTQTRSRRYLQIIAKNPSDVDAHLQLGIIMAKAGDNKEAMNYFDKVLSLDPKNSVALNNRGDLLMTQESYKEAQKAFLMAAQATPKDAEIWIKLTKAYDATNDTAKAKEAFTQAQVLDPSVKSRYKELAKKLINAM